MVDSSRTQLASKFLGYKSIYALWYLWCLPIEKRVCLCGQIQTESHVIENCVMSEQIRQTYSFESVNDLMVTKTDFDIVCTIVHKLLAIY